MALSQRQKRRQKNKELAQLQNINIDLAQTCKEINESSEMSAVYIGADSKTFKKGSDRFCAYCVTVVLHKDGKHGAKIFKDIKIEKDFGDPKAPRLRLMNEVYKVIEVAQGILDSVGDRHFEIHLDLNSKEEFKSNGAVNEASGLIKGIFGIDAKIKPEAWCASATADRFAVKTATRAQKLAKKASLNIIEGLIKK